MILGTKTWRWESPDNIATLGYKTMRGYVARSVEQCLVIPWCHVNICTPRNLYDRVLLCERVGRRYQLCSSKAQVFACPMHNYIHGHEYLKLSMKFTSWLHTKPTSVRNKPGYIRTAVRTSELFCLEMQHLLVKNFWKTWHVAGSMSLCPHQY